MERLVETLVSKEDLQVKIGVYHGDLAPWNVKITPRGRVTVMDWEYGGLKGPAAWDWIHYLLQRASLVDHLSDAAALQVCRDWARTSKGKQFMIEAGWGDNVELCIGTYLIYSSSLEKFVHDSLLAEWIGK
jgi:thiamine kinase-like enzyme